jgi:hypothetical protein
MAVKLQVRLLVRTLSVAVRGARRFASLPPRTYSGQGLLFTHLKIEFDQVSSHPDDWEETVCKTVGSAYVGSNPTPATTCENGPLTALMRPAGPFRSCRAVYQHVSPWVDILRCPRTHSGRRPCPSRGRCNRRLSTDGHGLAALAACSGLTCAAGPDVHRGGPPVRPGSSPGRGGWEGRVRWWPGRRCGALRVRDMADGWGLGRRRYRPQGGR